MPLKAIICCVVGTAIFSTAAAEAQSYRPSAIQRRVDASFSNIPVNTDLSTVRSRLRELRVHGCEQEHECNWVDSNGVEHYFFGDPEEASSRWMMIKIVEADRVGRRPISAFGIGTARTQAQVLANVRRFLGSAARVTCGGRPSGNVGDVECGVSLSPGWAQIGFTRNGQLQAVRFDAYQAN